MEGGILAAREKAWVVLGRGRNPKHFDLCEVSSAGLGNPAPRQAGMPAATSQIPSYRHSADISPKQKNSMIRPLIATPAMAAKRFAFLAQATRLRMNAIGGVRTMASPPRAVRGECHPGCSSTISAIVAGATSDKPKPTRPLIGCGWSSRGGIGRPDSMPESFTFPSISSRALQNMGVDPVGRWPQSQEWRLFFGAPVSDPARRHVF